jgi:FkbM family methyltransferase
MIDKVRQYIMRNTPIIKIFNKIGGLDYAIYNRKDIIEGAQDILYYETKKGIKYNVDGFSNYIPKYTKNEYDWSDLKPDDIILEMGATIGDQTIFIAKKVKHVYAIEPIYTEQLNGNIALNKVSNITVIPDAIGNGSLVTISHNKNIKTIYSKTPSNIDGYEWFIKPEDLNGVRRIEMEVHPYMFPYETYNPQLIPYIKQNYNITINKHENRIYILHAYKRDTI